MRKYLFFTLIIISCVSSGYSEKPKADISFLCFDLKYNKQDGVKICEMQQGIISGFYTFYKGTKIIAPMGERFCQFIEPYNDSFWVVKKEISYNFRTALNQRYNQENPWHGFRKNELLLQDELFCHKKSLQPIDPYRIEDYHGFLIRVHLNNFSTTEFHQEYPGVLILNEAFYPHHEGEDRDDKYKASLLFCGDELLERLKPQWKLYPKKYSRRLVDEILDDFSSDMLVIKPQSGSQGRGILIIHRDDLEETLSFILSNSSKLRKKKDPSYSYWFSEENTDFLVEEYVPSDPINFPHLGEYRYFDGTMRVGVCLTYNNHEIDFHFLEGFWKVPSLPLESKGTLNEKHKSSYKRPYVIEIDSETREAVEEQLREALPILYERLVDLSR